jgi:uncharacterized membrane protein
LDYDSALLLFVLIVIGSFINIPLYRKRGRVIVGTYSFFGLIYYTIERRADIVIAVNLGGCIIPSLLAIKLLLQLPLIPFLIAFTICTAVIYTFAKPVPNVGIAVPMFIPPAISALTSYMITIIFGLPIYTLPKLAFSIGVLSALVGADILHLKDVEKIGSGRGYYLNLASEVKKQRQNK